MLYISSGLHPRRRHALTGDEFSGILPCLEEKSGYQGRVRPLSHAILPVTGDLGGSVYTSKKELSISRTPSAMRSRPWPHLTQIRSGKRPPLLACSGGPAAPVLRLLHQSPPDHTQQAPRSSVPHPQRPRRPYQQLPVQFL